MIFCKIVAPMIPKQFVSQPDAATAWSKQIKVLGRYLYKSFMTKMDDCESNWLIW